MSHPPEIVALLEKYPTLRKPIETGIESNDGREQTLLTYITLLPNLRNNPTAVLAAIDDFSLHKDFMISIGPHKAGVLSSLLLENKPQTVVELGGYLGYSAILFASTLLSAQAQTADHPHRFHIYSLEFSPEFAAISRQVIDLAGLSGYITVIVGPASDSLKSLKTSKEVEKIDFLFIDHVKELYISDFKIAEELGLLKRGAVVVADNVVRPGAPEYRALVRVHDGLRSEGVRGLIVPGDGEDELEVSHVLKDLGGDE